MDQVRDEIRMTIAAYQTLYESSIAFGIRKALVAEQKKTKMEAKVPYRVEAVSAAVYPTESLGCWTLQLSRTSVWLKVLSAACQWP